MAALQEDNFYILKVYVENKELKEKWLELAAIHNEKIEGEKFPDSGVDVPVVENFTVPVGGSMFVNFGVKTAMFYNGRPSGFYLYPRSSTFKNYKIMLGNNTGIIDPGYRGEIGAYLCVFPDISLIEKGVKNIDVKKHARLTQICASNLAPIKIVIVDDILGLSSVTNRGSGGFGSTGK